MTRTRPTNRSKNFFAHWEPEGAPNLEEMKTSRPLAKTLDHSASDIFRFYFAQISPMGGERGWTARQRLTGQICCSCKRSLYPPYSGRESYCSTCRPQTHRIYMHFFLRDGWHIQFSELDLKTVLPRKLTFSTPAKIRHMHDLYGAKRSSRTNRPLITRSKLDVARYGRISPANNTLH